MKRPSFLEGAILALGISVVAAMLYTALSSVFSNDTVLRFVITASSLVYLLYLLSRSGERVGRVSTLALWIIASLGIWILMPSIGLLALLHLTLIWLIRSLYFYESSLPALADLGLCGVAFSAAIWATLQTGSLFLTLWFFFLVQALFVAIPANLSRSSNTASSITEDDIFDRAHRSAENALRKLSTLR